MKRRRQATAGWRPARWVALALALAATACDASPDTTGGSPDTALGATPDAPVADAWDETAEPDTDVAEPEPDTAEPDTDVAEPEPDTAEADTDVAEPEPDTAEADTDEVEPKPDAVEPDTDVAEPKPDTAEPDTDVAEPKPDTAEPDTDVAEPKPDTAEPDTDVAEPKPDTAEPDSVVACPLAAPCDDGDPCTAGDACLADGTCVGVAKCPASGPCLAVACAPATGACVVTPTLCDDGDPCTDDSCEAGLGCTVTAKACDDGDPCTVDSCKAGLGCTFTAKTCDDGDACTLDVCGPDGACLWPPAVACDDGDACTVDACNPASGACTTQPVPGCGVGDPGVARLNQYRALVGLPALTADPAIGAAAQAHCDFVALHWETLYGSGSLSPHNEAEGYAGFTGVSFGARMLAAGYEGTPFSEVIAFFDDPDLAVDAWIASLYHRLPFVLPRTTDAGYGSSVIGVGFYAGCDTVDAGIQGLPPFAYTFAVSAFPPDGAMDVPRRWNGNELPTPPLPSGESYPVGPVLTLTFGVGHNPTDVTLDGSSLVGPAGEVPHVANDPSSDPSLCCGVLTLYAHDPLEPETTYTATVDYTWSGQPDTFTWSFTTGTGESELYTP